MGHASIDSPVPVSNDQVIRMAGRTSLVDAVLNGRHSWNADAKLGRAVDLGAAGEPVDLPHRLGLGVGARLTRMALESPPQLLSVGGERRGAADGQTYRGTVVPGAVPAPYKPLTLLSSDW